MTGNFFLKNGKIFPVNENCTLPQNAMAIVYEVLRVVDGIPVFVEEHQSRLEKSCALATMSQKYNVSCFTENVKRLISGNGILEGNIMCRLFYFNDHIDDFYYFIPHSYPTEKQYREGVDVDLLNVERKNPEAKIVQQSVRELSDQFIKEHQLFEALLVDHENVITEGSRSNVFFVNGETIVSAPESKILLGITFLHVVQICRDLGFKIDYSGANINNLESYQAAFITGTSPRVLPIKRVGTLKYDNSNAVVRKVMDAYNKQLSDYVLAHQ